MPAATKKIPFLWIVATAIVCIVVTRGITLQSHSTNKETLLAFKRVDSSLTVAKQVLINSNEIISATMQEKKKKPEFTARVLVWLSKIDSAIELANKMVDQIEELKHQLKKEAGLHKEDSKEIFNEDDPNPAERLMIGKEEGKKLETSLTIFSKNLVNLLPEERRNKLPKLAVQNLLQQTQTEDKNSWAEVLFKNIPTIGALALLSKFQNDVLLSGNLMAEFCKSQVDDGEGDLFEKFEVLVYQNSSFLMPGDTLVIKAGIGAFSNAAKQVTIIDGTKTEVTDYGFATYSKVVSGTGGKIPVSISFKNPSTGEPVTKRTEVTYKVAQPK